jgi:TRAP-type C4-dicarboxylate transport system substrate-binding protein
LVVKTFEGALKELNDEKKEFTKKYGVHVHNFNPVEIKLIKKSKEAYKEIASLRDNIGED